MHSCILHPSSSPSSLPSSSLELTSIEFSNEASTHSLFSVLKTTHQNQQELQKIDETLQQIEKTISGLKSVQEELKELQVKVQKWSI